MNKLELQPNIEPTKFEQFSKIREEVNKSIDQETEKRIEENPHPTEEEIRIGAFREMLEPQTREALFEMNRKGYSTESSGFAGEYGEIQMIDGHFILDDETKKEIEGLGAKVSTGEEKGFFGDQYTFIEFKPVQPDLNNIKTKWNEIVALLPDLRRPAEPSISGASLEFREKYATGRNDIEKEVLQKRLNIGDINPDDIDKIKRKIEKL